jgi:SAM-dependent methyltransferase
MFFASRIKSIKPEYRVLEIGPGSSPHSRSDEFLELSFVAEDQRLAQRGGTAGEPNFGAKPVHYYDGGVFPFEDGQFDYVICSHVIEHVSDPELFVNELNRVSGGQGYLEYPLVTCEYLYNFDVHLNLVKFDEKDQVLKFIRKCDTPLSVFSPVSALFHKTLEKGWDDLTSTNKELFFEGFEFARPLSIVRAERIEDLLPSEGKIVRKSRIRWFVVGCLNWLRI